jgi:hypothetical protein
MRSSLLVFLSYSAHHEFYKIACGPQDITCLSTDSSLQVFQAKELRRSVIDSGTPPSDGEREEGEGDEESQGCLSAKRGLID